MINIQDIIDRHDKIALQLSGGRDSMACLHLLRPWLDKITVYWCNTGAAFPETVAIMDEVRVMGCHFVEVDGNQPGVIQQYGMPSDIVPTGRTYFGLSSSQQDSEMLQDRYLCCARTMMIPMNDRMIADGITLIIRGQRNSDSLKATTKSGDIIDGIELLYPIDNWTTSEVMQFLKQQGATIPRFYEMLESAPDCMTCSAWWEHGTAKYLKRYHYPAYIEVQRRFDIINKAVGESIANFNKEVI